MPETTEQNELMLRLENTIKAVVNDAAGPLLQLMDIVSKSISVTLNGDKPMGKSLLTMDELYALAIKIPVECVYLQTTVNEFQTSQMLGDIVTENKITEHIVDMYGSKGDAKERLRRAELLEGESILQLTYRKQIARELQAIIDRADKVYEGVKKVIDAKSKEGNFDNKMQ